MDLQRKILFLFSAIPFGPLPAKISSKMFFPTFVVSRTMYALLKPLPVGKAGKSRRPIHHKLNNFGVVFKKIWYRPEASSSLIWRPAISSIEQYSLRRCIIFDFVFVFLFFTHRGWRLRRTPCFIEIPK